jgi:hypothetical protein
VSEVAQPAKICLGKLGRYQKVPYAVTRFLLAKNNEFTEVSLNVFENNRLSSVLDTGKWSRSYWQGRSLVSWSIAMMLAPNRST